MIFGVANNGHANAESGGDGALGYALCRVIRAFGVDVGPQLPQERFDVGFGEEHDVVYAAEGRHELRARVFIENRPAGPLQIAHAGIRVYANDQNIAFAACAFKIADVPYVERIEAAVREDDAPALALVFRELFAKHISRRDFGSGCSHDSADSSGGFTANGIEKLLARNSGRTAFHHHEASGDVGDVCGFERRGSASECKSVGSENRVACARDIEGLIAAVHGNLGKLIMRFKKSHAVAPTSDEERLKLHGCECCAARAGEFLSVSTYRGVMLCLDLGLVWSSRRDASLCIGVKPIASVKRDGQIILAFPGGLVDQVGSGYAKTVIRNGECVSFAELRGKLLEEFFSNGVRQSQLRFVVHAKNLLRRGVRPAGEEARFCWGGPALHSDDSRNIDALAAEMGDQRIADRVITNGADGQDTGAKRCQIVGSVCTAAWNKLRFAVLQDQHGGLARDAGDFAKAKFVGNKIAEKYDGLRGKLLDTFGERNEVDRSRC